MADFLFAVSVTTLVSAILLKRKERKQQQAFKFQKVKEAIRSGARDWLSASDGFTAEQTAELTKLLQEIDPNWRRSKVETKKQLELEPEEHKEPDSEEEDEEESEPEERPKRRRRSKATNRDGTPVVYEEDEEDED